MTGNFTWDNLEVRDVLKVLVGLGRPTPGTDFVDNPGHTVRLGRDDIVRVNGKSETHVTLAVVEGAEEVRGRNFTVKRHTEFSWLTDHFTRVDYTGSPAQSGKDAAPKQDKTVTKPTKGKRKGIIKFSDLKVGDRFLVKPGAKPTPFSDGTFLPDNTVVTVTDLLGVGDGWDSLDDEVILKITYGKPQLLKSEFSTDDMQWLIDNFSKIEKAQNVTFDSLKVGDRFLVKPGIEPLPDFQDEDTYGSKLPDGTVVRVREVNRDGVYEEQHYAVFAVAQGKVQLRGRQFTVPRDDIEWLDNNFTRFSEVTTTQEDITMNKTPVSMKETTTMFKVGVVNHKATEAVKQGLKQAGARMAHRALIAQVEKAFGRKFPKAFFSTPAGKAMLDLGSCYLVMMATEMVPEHPLATKANEVAGLALTAATYDHAVPLIEVATRLIEGAAGIDILGK